MTRLTFEGAPKCCLRDFLREELTSIKCKYEIWDGCNWQGLVRVEYLC